LNAKRGIVGGCDVAGSVAHPRRFASEKILGIFVENLQPFLEPGEP
jgi:hypothetical protein